MINHPQRLHNFNISKIILDDAENINVSYTCMVRVCAWSNFDEIQFCTLFDPTDFIGTRSLKKTAFCF